MAQSIGKVSQIIGPVVDVEFSGENNSLPKRRGLKQSHACLFAIFDENTLGAKFRGATLCLGGLKQPEVPRSPSDGFWCESDVP